MDIYARCWTFFGSRGGSTSSSVPVIFVRGGRADGGKDEKTGQVGELDAVVVVSRETSQGHQHVPEQPAQVHIGSDVNSAAAEEV